MKIIQKIIFLFALTLSTPGFCEEHISLDLPDSISIQDASGEELKTFTLQQLRTEFPQHTYNTLPIGDKHRKTFKGPFLEEVLERAGIQNERAFKVIAYDDFVTTINLSDILDRRPILAVEALPEAETCESSNCLDDPRFAPIDFNDKGPSRVVWPYAGNPLLSGMSWIYYPVIIRAER